MKLTQENREKLKAANKMLTKLINTHQNITLSELNTIHYSTAIVIASTNEINPLRVTTKFDLDQITNLKIE